MTDTGRRCKDCGFFVKTHYAMGDCRRHPPAFHNVPPQHPYGDMPQRSFPRVQDRDWCGDFQLGEPREAE